MRLWSLHPKYLDARGLVALWREALLAQAVLAGQTIGYTRHPQLIRFRDSASPLDSIAAYLHAVHAEGTWRGYRFDATKLPTVGRVEAIVVTQGQVIYECAHLAAKLRVRAPSWLARLEPVSGPEAHPLFRVVAGAVADWEVAQPLPRTRRTRRSR